MFLCVYTFIFTSFILKNYFVISKNDVLNNFHLIVDIAESLDIKFVVIVPLENIGKLCSDFISMGRLTWNIYRMFIETEKIILAILIL